MAGVVLFQDFATDFGEGKVVGCGVGMADLGTGVLSAIGNPTSRNIGEKWGIPVLI